jgi:hypothetical protein
MKPVKQFDGYIPILLEDTGFVSSSGITKPGGF